MWTTSSIVSRGSPEETCEGVPCHREQAWILGILCISICCCWAAATVGSSSRIPSSRSCLTRAYWDVSLRSILLLRVRIGDGFQSVSLLLLLLGRRTVLVRRPVQSIAAAAAVGFRGRPSVCRMAVRTRPFTDWCSMCELPQRSLWRRMDRVVRCNQKRCMKITKTLPWLGQDDCTEHHRAVDIGIPGWMSGWPES